MTKNYDNLANMLLEFGAAGLLSMGKSEINYLIPFL
jgi:hypothetical protein